MHMHSHMLYVCVCARVGKDDHDFSWCLWRVRMPLLCTNVYIRGEGEPSADQGRWRALISQAIKLSFLIASPLKRALI